VHVLREKGFNAFVIRGGFKAWTEMKGDVETVPAEDILVLPRFS
jgi:hypothetical protein